MNLLAHKYKKIGWWIFVPITVLGLFVSITNIHLEFEMKLFSIINGGIFSDSKYFSFVQTDPTNTILGVLFIVGALLVSFSKEKVEDEFISELRRSSLLWAVLVNYVLLLFAFIFIYGTAFITVMIYNMFTVLIIFIARFNYLLYRNSKTLSDEK